ncbi:MAG: terminase gpA endonuclease subunit [Novosphingobium sp.]
MRMQRLEPIPPFESGAQLIARLACLYRPKAHLTVSQWAARYMPNYDPAALPYLAEIMDALSDPETSEVGDMGPAQAGKSLIGEAWIGWSIEHDPADFLTCQPDKALMQDFVVRRINPLIANAPVLKAQLLPTASADNIFLKQFRGMLLTSIWPVGSQFRARPVPRGWLDDYDQFPDDIEDQGSAIKLLDGRQTTFEGRDTKLVSSSPAKEKGGIEAFVASGTDERLQPICPECGDRIELDLARDLKFDRGTLDEAEASAHVVCPASGCVLDPGAKRALLNSCADLPHHGFVAANKEASRRRRTFRRDGLLAFTSWGKLAREWRDAEIAWEDRQDENALRTFFNVKAGKNYRSKLSGEKPVEARELKQRMEPHWTLGSVPRGPKVINIVVDAQHDRFECAAIGTAAGRETWLIDRFAIHVLDDGLTGIQPFLVKEHWKVLLPLFDRKYPLVDGGAVVGHAPILSVAVDTGGSDKAGDQATEGAKFFFAAAKAVGVHPNRITLLKGGSNINGKLMPPGQFADQKLRGGAKRNSARLWIPNVHKIKNMIDARLRCTVPGAGYLHLPGDLAEEYLAEITAEELKDGKWQKRRARNETWDHLVYGEAAILKPPFAQSQSHMRWIPRGFGVIWPPKSEIAAAADAPGKQTTPAAQADPETKASAAKSGARRKPARRKPKGWMGRLK